MHHNREVGIFRTNADGFRIVAYSLTESISPFFALMEKVPLSDVMAFTLLPCTLTVAAGKGFPRESFTTPFTCAVCANTCCAANKKKTQKQSLQDKRNGPAILAKQSHNCLVFVVK